MSLLRMWRLFSALNTRDEIQRLIATGIFLIELLYQVPSSERGLLLFPFNSEQIRVRRL